MQSVINVIVQNPTVRAAVLIVLVAVISFYLGTSPVRRGILYHIGVFAPSLVRRHRRRSVSLELEMVLARALDMLSADRPDSDSLLRIRVTCFSRCLPLRDPWRGGGKFLSRIDIRRWTDRDGGPATTQPTWREGA
jgi:hypothetical protein